MNFVANKYFIIIFLIIENNDYIFNSFKPNSHFFIITVQRITTDFVDEIFIFAKPAWQNKDNLNKKETKKR